MNLNRLDVGSEPLSINLDKEPLESLEIIVEPGAFVNVGSYLLRKNLALYSAVLRGNPIFKPELHEFDEFMEDIEDKCIRKLINGFGIGIVLDEKENRKSAALIKHNKTIAHCVADDYDCFHLFYGIQPKIFNDSMVVYVAKGILIPTQFGSNVFQYSLKGHHIKIKRGPIKSINESNFGTRLERALKMKDVY